MKIGELLFPNYVSENAKRNILKYKYVGCDNSFIANHILQPFWRSLVDYLPMRMAPNLITLVGFFFIIFGYLVNLYYLPEMKVVEGMVPPPRWIYLFNVLCIFVYQTMDALDGKQARRTCSSSGLGELFDHGCDSLTTFFVVHSFLSSLQLGISDFTVLSIMIVMVTFYFCQWEQYHTDVMTLGQIGPTESQLSMMAGHLLTWYFGEQFWTQLIHIPYLDMVSPLNVIVITLVALGTLVSMFMNVLGVFKSGNKPFALCVNQIALIIFLFYTSTYWSQKYPLVLVETPQMYMALFGFLASFITCRLILSRICQDSVPIFQHLFLPLIFVYLPTDLFPFDMSLFIAIYFITTFIVYMHFTYVVIDTICGVLNIKCFRLKRNAM